MTMPSVHQILSFPDLPTAGSAMASTVADLLRAAIKARNHASLVVSGGRSPMAFFRCLCHAPLPWEKIAITLSDERQVDQSSELSNAKLVRGLLLQDKASLGNFVPILGPETMSRLSLPFDVVVLGMGKDGHIASLFRNSPLDPNTLPEILEVTPNPLPEEAPVPRWSLNLAALLCAQHVFLLVNGARKRATLNDALTNTEALSLPIGAALMHAPVPIQIFLADDE